MTVIRRDRLWWPCDVDFWDHPAVIEAGEAAGVLYQRLLAWAKVHHKDGWVPVRQPRAWYDDWKPRLDALVQVGLVTVGTQNIALPDWDKWHEPNKQRLDRVEAKRQSDRERQARKRRRERGDLALSTEEQELSTSTKRSVTRQSQRESRRDIQRDTRDSNGHKRLGPIARVQAAADLADKMFRPGEEDR